MITQSPLLKPTQKLKRLVRVVHSKTRRNIPVGIFQKTKLEYSENSDSGIFPLEYSGGSSYGYDIVGVLIKFACTTLKNVTENFFARTDF